MKKTKRIIIFLAILILTNIATRFVTLHGLFLGTTDKFNNIVQLENFIKKHYLFKVDEKNFEIGELKGAVASLKDPYSEYLSPEEMDALTEETTGKFFGIGVYIAPGEDGLITVISPIKGSPAEKAGLNSGDKILQINGKDYTGDNITEASKAIRGEKDSLVKLLVLKNGSKKPQEISVKRDQVKIASVIEKELGEIGYIGITVFDEDTDKEFGKALDDLVKKNKPGIILDLRGNPGGVVDAAVGICDKILPEGVIVTLKDNQNKIIEEYKSDKNYVDTKMVVLQNGGSASASEILAGAIRDYKRATIVGEKSYGKGIVQTVFPLAKGSGLKLTTAEYFTPSGKSIHKLGIEPDIKVKEPEGIKGIGVDFLDTDTQLQKALEILKK
ncbi:MAG: S41 family peptidase [Peptoniphilus lacrimalis]